MAIWRAVFPSYAYAHDAASSRKICHGDRLVLSVLNNLGAGSRALPYWEEFFSKREG